MRIDQHPTLYNWRVTGTVDEMTQAAAVLGGQIRRTQQGNKIIDVVVERVPLVLEKARALGAVEIAGEVEKYAAALLRQRQAYKKLLAAQDDYPDLSRHQVVGAAWLAQRKRAILADPTGAGKTRTSLASLLWSDNQSQSKILVVSKKSARYQWQREIGIIAPETVVHVPPSFADMSEPQAGEVWVVSWSALSSNKLWVKDWLQNTDWTGVIFDEAHALRALPRRANAGSAGRSNRATVAAKISARAKWVELLTATPTDGRPEQWFGLLHQLDPKRFSSKWRWVDMFTSTGLNLYNTFVEGAPRCQDIMEDVLVDYVLRRTVDMGIRVDEKVVYLEMNDLQKNFYKQQERLYRVEHEGQVIVNAASDLANQVRLRQIIVSPMLVGGPVDSVTVDALLDELEGLDYSQNAVVFSTFVNAKTPDGGVQTDALFFHIRDRIKQELPEWDVRMLTGRTKDTERAELEGWMRDGRRRVLLASTAAGGESVNLQGAQVAIFLDRPWSSIEDTQARGRLPRRGQRGDVLFVRFVVKGSISEVAEQTISEIMATRVDEKVAYTETQLMRLAHEKIVTTPPRRTRRLLGTRTA